MSRLARFVPLLVEFRYEGYLGAYLQVRLIEIAISYDRRGLIGFQWQQSRFLRVDFLFMTKQFIFKNPRPIPEKYISKARRIHIPLKGTQFNEKVATEFWRVWEEVGEPHKHGFYESTWMAIWAALEASGDEDDV